jgi:PAS domain S-box-containing protein
VSKRAGDASLASEEFFRSIFENVQVGIGIYDVQAGTRFTNPAMHEILGYTEAELSRTEQWDEIVHPADRAQGARRFGDLVEGRRDKDVWEQRIIRRDGCAVIIKSESKLIRDAAGKPKYVITLNEDVTDRRHAEAGTTRVTKQTQLLLDSIGQGVYGVDLEGKCTFINKTACE